MAISAIPVMTLRPDLELLRTQGDKTTVYPNKRKGDSSRKKESFDYHLVELTNSKKIPAIVQDARKKDDDKFHLFKEKVKRCKDTDMLLLICNAFHYQLNEQNSKRYASYLFAKLIAWGDKEPLLYSHLNALLDLDISNEQTTEIAAATFNGLNVLTKAIRDNKAFYAMLNIHSKAEKSRKEAALRELDFSTDENVLSFLVGLHREKSRAFIAQQIKNLQDKPEADRTEADNIVLNNAILLKTNEEILAAKNAIAMFPWDRTTQEQKFVQKVINALKQKGNEITINVGLKQKAQKFDRNQLLVLIRSNPLLCSEFKKALEPKSLSFLFGQTTLNNLFFSDSHERALFTNDDFLESARNLLGSNQLLSCYVEPQELNLDDVSDFGDEPEVDDAADLDEEDDEEESASNAGSHDLGEEDEVPVADLDAVSQNGSETGIQLSPIKPQSTDKSLLTAANLAANFTALLNSARSKDESQKGTKSASKVSSISNFDMESVADLDDQESERQSTVSLNH